MTVFKVSTRRLDPYKNFRFLVLWKGSRTPVAGFSRVGPIKRRASVAQRRKIATTNSPPGRTSFESITLEHGVTHDREFLKWASKVPPSAGTSPGLRRDLWIERRSGSGRAGQRYKVLRCCVSEFRKPPDPDADVKGVAIARIRLEHGGWERDLSGRAE
jgi:phage tail-like protein